MSGSQSGAAVPGDQVLLGLAADLGERLRHMKRTVTSAESCTGGWIAKVFTDVAGSSDWFGSAIVSYSNTAKQKQLGVSKEILKTHGAVSAETVDAMATGALRIAGADWSIAVSGVAGPDGGTADKPVGLVWFAWAGSGYLEHEQHVFSGDREAVRRQTVHLALQGLLHRI